ncbi:MAG: PadR family transcriptional regulator, partial [Pseudomonadota bacterium]
MHIKTLCLGALCFGDATGYDIKKLFEAAFNHFHTASFGSIYPALSQLQDAGLVTHSVEPGDKHPDRKLFRVTDEGRDAFLK